ncbi:hypothetical protein PIB30_041706 [Stylosanthes scabra]|uniref:Uncharacterized protein n=1 Tax=Stylosanthes scabra TaxID=79078 RepID=A0ABU6VDT3_9FABA|nr:hypothetical protein [Stylosanthes scabra]
MKSNIVLRVYFNGGIIPDTQEGVSFASESSITYVVLCFTSFSELRNSICQSVDTLISKVVSSILYRNPIVVFGGLMQFQPMPITDDASMRHMFQIHWNTQAQIPLIELCGFNIENVGEEEEANTVGQIAMEAIAWQQQNVRNATIGQDPYGAASFMRVLHLETMNAPEFLQHANQAVVGEDGEFCVGMEFGSSK